MVFVRKFDPRLYIGPRYRRPTDSLVESFDLCDTTVSVMDCRAANMPDGIALARSWLLTRCVTAWRRKALQPTSSLQFCKLPRQNGNWQNGRRWQKRAPTTAWIVKRREIQITIILSRLNCSVTRDSGRDCIKDVYISRNQLCSDLPKFLLLIHPHRYRTSLPTTSSVHAKYRTRVTLGPNLVYIRIGPRPYFGGSFVHINK